MEYYEALLYGIVRATQHVVREDVTIVIGETGTIVEIVGNGAACIVEFDDARVVTMQWNELERLK